MLDVLIGVAISSLLVAISMPGYLYGGFIFIALVPLFFALERKGPVFFCTYFIFSSTFINFNYLIPVLTTGFPELFGRFSSVTGFLFTYSFAYWSAHYHFCFSVFFTDFGVIR